MPSTIGRSTCRTVLGAAPIEKQFRGRYRAPPPRGSLCPSLNNQSAILVPRLLRLGFSFRPPGSQTSSPTSPGRGVRSVTVRRDGTGIRTVLGGRKPSGPPLFPPRRRLKTSPLRLHSS